MKNRKIKDIAKVVTSAMVSSGPYEWPPSCILFSYQPLRPEQENVQRSNLNTCKGKEET